MIEGMSEEVARTISLITAYRASEFDTFRAIMDDAGPNDYAAAIGMLHLAMLHLAREQGYDPDEYLRGLALMLAS